MARQIVIDIVGDSRKFSQSTSSAIASAEKMPGKFRAIGSGIGKGLAVGLGAFYLLSQAIQGIIGVVGDMDKAFKEDQASQVLLGTALQNNIDNWDGNTTAVEAYASAQAQLGFTDDEVRQSIGQLIGVTHDLNDAQELNTLAQELARAKGIDLATATDIVTKAQQGNGRALKALGIDVAGATTGAELLDRIQQNVTGSAEAWAQTSEGRTAVSQVKVGEAMEKIGAIIDKVAQVVIPALAAAFVWVSDVISAAIPHVQKVITALGPTFQTIGTIAGVVFKGIGVAIGVAFEVAKVWFAAWGVIIGGLIGAFRGVASVVSTVFSSVTGIVRGAINGVIAIINGMIGAINAIQVHIHVGPVNIDWNGLRIGKLPYLHAGGIVPGAPGSDQLALLQAGERVIPANAAGSSGVTVNFYGPVFGDDQFIDDFSRKFATRLRTSG